MSPDATRYYFLGILVLITAGFGIGTLIAGRMSRRREAADQEQDKIHTPND